MPWVELSTTDEDWKAADPALLGTMLAELHIIRVFEEVVLELAGEGHRFFDLVRTERAAAAIPAFEVGKHEIFPIPLLEIELAGNVWAQNPGY